jgi:hypothetical protein
MAAVLGVADARRAVVACHRSAFLVSVRARAAVVVRAIDWTRVAVIDGPRGGTVGAVFDAGAVVAVVSLALAPMVIVVVPVFPAFAFVLAPFFVPLAGFFAAVFELFVVVFEVIVPVVIVICTCCGERESDKDCDSSGDDSTMKNARCSV